MISYSQNHEDVLLNRVFAEVETGTYVDVGAGSPTSLSVSWHFYQKGWKGVNIEPRPDMFAQLLQHRPRDINLNIGIANSTSEMVFFRIEVGPEPLPGGEGGGLSTFSRAAAEAARAQYPGAVIEESLVKVIKLKDVFGEYHLEEVSFVKIDVEGFEREVVEGMDWRRWRPIVLVIESIDHSTQKPAHDKWEQLLLEQDYLFANFDGLNRYYVRAENRELLERFAAPVNVMDDYVPVREVMLEREVAELRERIMVEGEVARLAEALHALGPIPVKLLKLMGRVRSKARKLFGAT